MTDEKALMVSALPAGTYRVIDGKLHRIEPGLPPALDGRDADIATLRARLTAAEGLLREVAVDRVELWPIYSALRARIEAHLGRIE